MEAESQVVHLVWRTFEREFAPVSHKFDFVVIDGVKAARESKDYRVTRPGVYVWADEERVVKVGRHLVNARKRALEHVSDDTGGKMARLEIVSGVKLILLTVHPDDWHWAGTVEMYMERMLDPDIRSGRTG